jgi:hypothetical protein
VLLGISDKKGGRKEERKARTYVDNFYMSASLHVQFLGPCSDPVKNAAVEKTVWLTLSSFFSQYPAASKWGRWNLNSDMIPKLQILTGIKKK